MASHGPDRSTSAQTQENTIQSSVIKTVVFVGTLRRLTVANLLLVNLNLTISIVKISCWRNSSRGCTSAYQAIQLEPVKKVLFGMTPCKKFSQVN